VVVTKLMRPDKAITPSMTKIENKEMIRKSLKKIWENEKEQIKRVIKVIISKRIILKRILEDLSKKIKLIRTKDKRYIYKLDGTKWPLGA
jgi:hypothetical protein